MNLFSPDRARQANGTLMYYDEIGPVAAIPKLQIELLPDCEHEVKISVVLLDSPNCGRWYEMVLSTRDLTGWLFQWIINPEQVLRDDFKWPGMMREKPKEKFDLAEWMDIL